MIKTKFIYRSSPIFRESDEESVKAWESRPLETMLIYCKLYQSEDGTYAIGYSILFEDGWEYGRFHENLGKVKDIKEASLKGFYEILLHAQEEKAKKVIVWTENTTFLENMKESDIRRKKPLRELYESFEQIKLSNLDAIEIENIEKLREYVFSSAKSGSQFRTRRKRFHVILRVTDKDEPPGEAKRRMDEFSELMAEVIHRYMTRPADEKIRDAENELREIENNIDEQPDFEEKRTNLLAELEDYKKEKTETDKRLKKFEKQKAEQETRRKAEDERIKKILVSRNLCIECGKKIEKDWKCCPYCSATINVPV